MVRNRVHGHTRDEFPQVALPPCPPSPALAIIYLLFIAVD